MYIEDLIITLSFLDAGSLSEKVVIYNFSDQINSKQALTQKQATLALKLLNRYSFKISEHLNKDITPFLDTPIYRYPFRQLTNTRKLSVIDDLTFGKIIKIEFPYNQELITEIQIRRRSSNKITWNRSQRAWLAPLSEENILYFVNLARINNFQIDQTLQDQYNNLSTIIECLEDYAPMLAVDQGKLYFKNVSEQVPQLTATDTLSAIFEARKRGIFLWDNEISSGLESMDIDPFVKHFLKSEPTQPFHVNSDTTSFKSIGDIIKHLSPCLFIIPGGLELEKVNLAYGLLKSLEISNEEISVLFRLPSSTGNDFNQYVKNSKINNRITESTRAIFISTRVPKTIIKSNIRFHSVINLGFGGVHYSIKRFIESRENLIYFSENNKQKEFNFGYM